MCRALAGRRNEHAQLKPCRYSSFLGDGDFDVILNVGSLGQRSGFYKRQSCEASPPYHVGLRLEGNGRAPDARFIFVGTVDPPTQT
jgi:hypothetical protein